MSTPKVLVVATNIKWSVTEEEALELLDDMPDEEAARIFELPVARYAEMTVEERHDYALDAWQHNRVSIEEFVHAPEEIVFPNPEDTGWDDDSMSDFISETGWCHTGYKVKCNLTKAQFKQMPELAHLDGIIDVFADDPVQETA